MCLYPTLIRNKKYTANKKNGGNVPPITDPRTEYVPIGCGDCMECRKQKAREWQIRLQEDIKTYKNGKFITLTFNNKEYTKLTEHENIKNLQGYQRDNAIATQATRYFLERWRKKYKKSLRHWLITELGHNGTQNIHMHGIIWTNETLETVEKIWKYGWMWKGKEKWVGEKKKLINYVNAKTVNYIIKYVTKKDNINTYYKSIILTSPGIGHNYTKTYDSKGNKFQGTDTREVYRTNTGHKLSLPNYYRNKLYNDQQKEQLWLQKLDKKERWICGEKVDISETEEPYYRLLKYHQKRNIKLGYGNGQKTWEQMEYETQRRNLMNEQRKKTYKEAEAASLLRNSIPKTIIYNKDKQSKNTK